MEDNKVVEEKVEEVEKKVDAVEEKKETTSEDKKKFDLNPKMISIGVCVVAAIILIIGCILLLTGKKDDKKEPEKKEEVETKVEVKSDEETIKNEYGFSKEDAINLVKEVYVSDNYEFSAVAKENNTFEVTVTNKEDGTKHIYSVDPATKEFEEILQ